MAVGVGLAVLAVTSYGFLAIAARRLSPPEFARLGVVWTILFTLGPGLFFPLEQDIGRRLAAPGSTHAQKLLVRRVAMVGAGPVLAVSAITLASTHLVERYLLDGDVALLVAMVLANAALAPVHISRGVLAGTGSFHRYAGQLATDGFLRLLGAGLLAAFAITSPAPYAWVLCFAQLLAVGVSLKRVRPEATELTKEPQSALPWRELGHSVGWLLVGTLAAQILVNGGVVFVKVVASPSDAEAAHFLTALVIARVPLFLFAALQVSLLPGMVRQIASGDTRRAWHSLTKLLVALTLLGTAATLVLLVEGREIISLAFGPRYVIATGPLVLLSIGSSVYMLAAAVAQALLAVGRVRAVAVVWVVGVSAFVAALALPGTLPMRASLALVIGAANALALFGLALRRAWRPVFRDAHRE